MAGQLFRQLLDLGFIICFAELGIGFLYALTHQGPPKKTLIRGLAIGITVPLLIMALVNLGYRATLPVRFSSTEDPAFLKLGEMRKLAAAAAIIKLPVMIALLVQASLVKHQYRKAAPSTNVSTSWMNHPSGSSNTNNLCFGRVPHFIWLPQS